MAGSGIEIPDTIIKTYEALQKNHKAKVLAFRMNDGKNPTKLVVDCIDGIDFDDIQSEADVNDAFTQVNNARSEGKMDNKEIIDFIRQKIGNAWSKSPRYIVCDLERTRKGTSKAEVHCIMWNPEDGGVKLKMIYASTYETFKQKLNGISSAYTFCGVDDFEGADFAQDV